MWQFDLSNVEPPNAKENELKLVVGGFVDESDSEYKRCIEKLQTPELGVDGPIKVHNHRIDGQTRQAKKAWAEVTMVSPEARERALRECRQEGWQRKHSGASRQQLVKHARHNGVERARCKHTQRDRTVLAAR